MPELGFNRLVIGRKGLEALAAQVWELLLYSSICPHSPIRAWEQPHLRTRPASCSTMLLRTSRQDTLMKGSDGDRVGQLLVRLSSDSVG